MDYMILFYLSQFNINTFNNISLRVHMIYYILPCYFDILNVYPQVLRTSLVAFSHPQPSPLESLCSLWGFPLSSLARGVNVLSWLWLYSLRNEISSIMGAPTSSSQGIHSLVIYNHVRNANNFRLMWIVVLLTPHTFAYHLVYSCVQKVNGSGRIT